MSRNIDKANTVLFRFQEQKAEQNGHIDYNSTARPRRIQSVKTLKDSENWRKQVIKEIDQSITRINDPKLSNFQIRDLNDLINKLLKEKKSWEYHIKDLGGPDYLSNRFASLSNSILIKKYRYFGRAKELSEVQNLLKSKSIEKLELSDQLNKQRYNFDQLEKLKREIDLTYYGFEDELPNLESHNYVEKQVFDEARDILGDLLKGENNDDDSDKDNEGNYIKDPLLKFERKASRVRTKKLSKIGSKNDIILIKDETPPNIQTVQKYLIDKRRKELELRYNI